MWWDVSLRFGVKLSLFFRMGLVFGIYDLMIRLLLFITFYSSFYWLLIFAFNLIFYSFNILFSSWIDSNSSEVPPFAMNCCFYFSSSSYLIFFFCRQTACFFFLVYSFFALYMWRASWTMFPMIISSSSFLRKYFFLIYSCMSNCFWRIFETKTLIRANIVCLPTENGF